jgi:hypothetical protein
VLGVACLHCSLRGCRSGGVPVTQQATAAAADLATVWLVENPLLTGPCAAHIPAVVCPAGQELLAGRTICTACPAGTVNPTPGGTCSTTCTAPKVANQAGTECGGCWAWLACTAACVGAAQHGCLSHSRRRQRRRWRRHQRTGAEQRLMMGRCTAPHIPARCRLRCRVPCWQRAAGWRHQLHGLPGRHRQPHAWRHVRRLPSRRLQAQRSAHSVR